MLFVGGKADGEFIKTAPKVTTHEVVVVPRFKGAVSSFDPVEKIEYERQHYEIQELIGRDRSYKIMLYDGLTIDNLFEKLIQNYRPI